LNQADIESLEQATVQAVPPEQLVELPGWLLPMDPGTVGRARSAVPLRHEGVNAVVLDRIVARYRDLGYLPALRLPDLPSFEPCHLHLLALGFVRRQPTQVMTGTIDAMLGVPVSIGGCDFEQRSSEAWMSMYQGAGLDPVDGACRARIMARAQTCRYASVGQDGHMLACGAASFGHGWLGVHGMRTAAGWGGRGLASRVLNGMAQLARQQAINRVFLQVDQSNGTARALYARFGLRDAWTYANGCQPTD
jgi:GNAT superfamily N-acetyltransferase